MGKRIMSGIQPSGQLHIGNYFGMMKPMLEMMADSKNEVFVMLADFHALSSLHNAEELRNNVKRAMIDWLACGLDPEKVTFYVQSDIPEVQELTWYLHTVTPMGLLERATSYKDKTAQGLTANSALFTYPVLQTADILLVNGEVVPVGKDQKQHIEMARDIAIKFNNEFGDVVVVPDVQISESTATVPGIDGKKMSKSYGNIIPLFDDESVIKKRIMSITTDSIPVEDAKDPETCNVFALYKLVASKSDCDKLEVKYRAGGMGYGEAKQLLFDAVKSYFSPMWAKRKVLEEDEGLVEKVRAQGAEKVQNIANELLGKIRKKVGVR